MCGIVGIAGKPTNEHRVTSIVALMLNHSQHRGYQGAGGAFVHKGKMSSFKDVGTVDMVFNNQTMPNTPCDFAGIGQVRYATSGAIKRENAQPFIKLGNYDVAVVHNGQIVNPVTLRSEIHATGGHLDGTSDSEIIAHLIAHSTEPTIEKAIESVCGKIRGAYSLLVLTADKLIAVRDPNGIRPLSIAHVDGPDGKFWAVASETCTFSIFGFVNAREVEPGTMMVIDKSGWRQIRFAEASPAFCIAEPIYLCRPDSYIRGASVQSIRNHFGQILARRCREDGIDAGIDCIAPIPESGIEGTIGYHRESDIPFTRGFIASRGAKRQFMEAQSSLRSLGVRLKQSIIPEDIDGKRIAEGDDSIFRGDTTGQMVMYCKEYGAREVHLRIFAPPIRFPCYYGIDIPTSKELIAYGRSIEEVAEELHAESLAYLTLQETYKAIGSPGHTLCHACMDGKYPIKIDPREVIREHD